MSHYMTFAGIKAGYTMINQTNSPKTYTCGFWDNLLRRYFSPDHFVVRRKEPSNMADGKSFFDIAVGRLQNQGKLKTIILVECAGRDYEGSNSEWLKAYDQLKTNLTHIFNTGQKHTGVKTLYGAVAVGRYIRFYSFARSSCEKGLDLEEFGPSNQDEQPWEAAEDEETIHTVLSSLAEVAFTEDWKTTP